MTIRSCDHQSIVKYALQLIDWSLTKLLVQVIYPQNWLKNVGRISKQKLYKLLLKVWDKEKLPAQWNEGIICPIHKIGETLKCNNYTPITLLNGAYKMFAIVLNKRILDTVEKSWKNVKWDFVHRNLLLTYLWSEKMFEKCYEHNTDLHNILVNYKQAFDSVCRNKILECSSPYNFPAKL